MGVKHAMIGHQIFEVKQTKTKTFMIKVQQKDWTVKASSEKLTLTYVNMRMPFTKVVSVLV